jgi:hypothetical protein
VVCGRVSEIADNMADVNRCGSTGSRFESGQVSASEVFLLLGYDAASLDDPDVSG